MTTKKIMCIGDNTYFFHSYDLFICRETGESFNHKQFNAMSIAMQKEGFKVITKYVQE